jgi:hypothetical protein
MDCETNNIGWILNWRGATIIQNRLIMPSIVYGFVYITVYIGNQNTFQKVCEMDCKTNNAKAQRERDS